MNMNRKGENHMSKNVPAKKNVRSPAIRLPYGNLAEELLFDPWFPFSLNDAMETFRLDVREDDDSYTVEAEVPGVKKNEISLSLDNSRLTIEIEEKEKSDSKKKVVHKERNYTYMERSIYLPDAGDNAEAKLDKGELIVTVPKRHSGKAKKKIEIK